MEKYIIVLLLTAPGFIAKKISKCLGDSPAPRSELENILVYFVYSLFSFLLVTVSGCDPDKLLYLFFLYFFAIMIISATTLLGWLLRSKSTG